MTIPSPAALFCVDTKWRSKPSTEASSTSPSVRKVEVSHVAAEPDCAGGLTILFKKDKELNQKVLVDIITEMLMQELLEDELSDMVLHGCPLPINRMKDISTQSTSISMDADMPYPHSETSTSSCRSAYVSVKASQDSLDTCVAGSVHTYDANQNYQRYYNPTKEDCSSPAIESPEIYRESFKLISERLVDKYTEENLEAFGLLSSSSLLELYASGKTLSLALGKPCLDGRECEEQLYGKMILEAVCEWLDNKYMRFCLPSFFLFLVPCPEGPQLKQTLVSKVNEHADAACEGGFSLENILEKSLDEEDWKTPYQEMLEVMQNVSDHVMMDLIENLLHDVMQVKQLACASQAAMEFVHTSQSKALLC